VVVLAAACPCCEEADPVGGAPAWAAELAVAAGLVVPAWLAAWFVAGELPELLELVEQPATTNPAATIPAAAAKEG
jgi:HAMP domain-containing protein